MVHELNDFLSRTPSAFHAIENLSIMLSGAGFVRLTEGEKWDVQRGGAYFVTRNLSSLIAFRVPEDGFTSARIAASHSDSPVFKIKENAELTVINRYVQLNTERYGGMIFSTWLDRPLSVAGRALVRTKSGLETRLVNLDEDTLVIPNVPIHMTARSTTAISTTRRPTSCRCSAPSTRRTLSRRASPPACGAKVEDLLGTDLFLYSRVQPAVWGKDGEFVSAGRLDDLECAYTTARAMIECRATKGMPVLAVFDNEEVGSTTKQGADSTFLTDVLRRAALCLGVDGEAFYRAQASSVMLSCDNAHAAHPNHPELYDASNRVYMNEGIVIKESANQKYTSDGASKAILRAILDNAGVKYQFFANRSDMLGGGTLGNISNAHFSLNTVDIGLAQLAMHSSWETAGSRDVDAMADGVRAFFETPISMPADGVFALN